MSKKLKQEKTRCLKGCTGHLVSAFITETYSRHGSRMAVTVTGIPAVECSVCHERLTDLSTFGEVERFVHPLLALGQTKGRLPLPHVTIEFPQFASVQRRSA